MAVCVCVCVYVCVNPGLVVDWKINRCCLHRPSQMESVTRVSLFLSLLSSSFSMEVCASLPFAPERSLIRFSRCVNVYQYKGFRGFQQVLIDYMLGFPSLSGHRCGRLSGNPHDSGDCGKTSMWMCVCDPKGKTFVVYSCICCVALLLLTVTSILID